MTHYILHGKQLWRQGYPSTSLSQSFWQFITSAWYLKIDCWKNPTFIHSEDRSIDEHYWQCLIKSSRSSKNSKKLSRLSMGILLWAFICFDHGKIRWWWTCKNLYFFSDWMGCWMWNLISELKSTNSFISRKSKFFQILSHRIMLILWRS